MTSAIFTDTFFSDSTCAPADEDAATSAATTGTRLHRTHIEPPSCYGSFQISEIELRAELQQPALQDRLGPLPGRAEGVVLRQHRVGVEDVEHVEHPLE